MAASTASRIAGIARPKGRARIETVNMLLLKRTN